MHRAIWAESKKGCCIKACRLFRVCFFLNAAAIYYYPARIPADVCGGSVQCFCLPQRPELIPLSGLTELKDLNICYNRIPDLTPLYGLTNLRRLWIYNSNDHNPSHLLDPNAVAALREALPDTYIDSVSSSVEGGWREHPHFYAIQRMFAKEGRYEPFEDVE